MVSVKSESETGSRMAVAQRTASWSCCPAPNHATSLAATTAAALQPRGPATVLLGAQIAALGAPHNI